ncbi:hypothetical protein D3C80_1721220 [compost metagenome]
MKRTVTQLQSDMNKMLDEYRISVEQIRTLKSELMKMRLRVSKMDGAYKRAELEATQPNGIVEESHETMQTMEETVNTPVAQIKNRRKQSFDKGQRRLDDFVNNRGKKRDAREVEEDEIQRKIIMRNSPGGTIQVSSTQESAVSTQENDQSEQ